jgi:hypothetical protein
VHRALPKAPPEILDILLGIEHEAAPVERNINEYGRALAEESGKAHANALTDSDDREPGIYTAKACGTCGCTCKGVEPLYPVATAAEIIPFPDEETLHRFLYTNKDKFPSRLRFHNWTQLRMLSQSEILEIRRMMIRRPTYTRGRPKGSFNGIRCLMSFKKSRNKRRKRHDRKR